MNFHIPTLSLLLAITFSLSHSLTHSLSTVPNWPYTYNDISRIQMNHSSFPSLTHSSTLAGLTPYGYRGDARRVHTALRYSIQHKNSLKIVILGASVSLGHGLPDWYNDRYSTRMKQYLSEVFTGVNISIDNLSIRASASDSQCDVLFRTKMNKMRSASLVLVDISVNDRPCHRDVKRVAKEVSSRVSEWTSNNATKKEVYEGIARQEKVAAEGRKLMKFLQYYLPKTTGIVYFETFVSGGRTHPLIRTAANLTSAHQEGYVNGRYEHEREIAYSFTCKGQDISRYYHWQPLIEYKIPVISYIDTVCPFVLGDLAPTPRLGHAPNAFWGRGVHHAPEFHDFTAVLLSHAIFEYAMHDISETDMDGELPTWMPHQRRIDKQQIADWNSYVYNPITDTSLDLDAKTIKCTMEPLSSGMRVRRHGTAWRFYEDVKGKPGWISSTSRLNNESFSPHTEVKKSKDDSFDFANTRTIVFEAKIPKDKPIIKMTFLMSYDKRMGSTSCCIDPQSMGSKYCQLIDTHWSDKTSQIVTVDISFPNLPVNNSKTIQKHELHCTADSGKVKIVDMVTC